MARWSIIIPAAATATAPSAAFAVEYLSGDQAQATIFPEAEQFQTREFHLDEKARSALESKLGLPVRAKWIVRLALRGGVIVGAVIVDDVIGKFDRITFAAGLGLNGVVREVEILAYRESHGQEVRQAAWRAQFAGKSESSPLRVGDDLSNISGATLSCNHVADGARRSIAVLASLRSVGALK